MFCRKCGAKINDDAAFCYKCGEKVLLNGAENLVENANKKSDLEVAQKSQSNNKMKIFLVIICVVVVGIICFFALKGDDKPVVHPNVYKKVTTLWKDDLNKVKQTYSGLKETTRKDTKTPELTSYQTQAIRDKMFGNNVSTTNFKFYNGKLYQISFAIREKGIERPVEPIDDSDEAQSDYQDSVLAYEYVCRRYRKDMQTRKDKMVVELEKLYGKSKQLVPKKILSGQILAYVWKTEDSYIKLEHVDMGVADVAWIELSYESNALKPEIDKIRQNAKLK